MQMLPVLESYYDTVPRATARTEEVGPFTLFVQAGTGWPFYARPRLGLDGTVTAADVHAVRARQRDLGVPEALEWVHETAPTLRAAAVEAGLAVRDCPLMVLDRLQVPEPPTGFRLEVLGPDPVALGAVAAAVSAGFGGTDEVQPREAPDQAALVDAGLLCTVGAYDDAARLGGSVGDVVVGGGSHSPRGATAELAGIAVVPRARRRGLGAAITAALVEDARVRGVETVFLSAHDDTVARVYARLGFVRVGTACVAEPAPDPATDPATD